MKIRDVRLLTATTVLAAGLACSPREPDVTEASEGPRPARARPAAPRTDALLAGPYRIGPLGGGTAPTPEAIGAVLPGRYTVRAPAEGAPAGTTAQVLLGEEVILDVFGSADGARIERAVSRHAHVLFPHDTRVGARIGSHPNWSRMTCALAEAPFEGEAVCNAFSEARIAYLIKGWAGPADQLPGKELLADLPISGLLWTPKAEVAEAAAP